MRNRIEGSSSEERSEAESCIFRNGAGAVSSACASSNTSTVSPIHALRFWNVGHRSGNDYDCGLTRFVKI